jgi:hypothetical protein
MLELEGVTRDAQIVEKREESHWGMHLTRTTLRYVTYKFSVDGRAYQGVAGMRPSLYRQIQPGDKMPVRYQASSDPK